MTTSAGGLILMATKFKDFLKEQLEDDDFRREYEALELETVIIQTFINAHRMSGITQQQLSEKTGISKSTIIKIENGRIIPSIQSLKRLAEGMGIKLKLEIQPA